jgi:uncharacterized membrane protein
MSHNAHRDLDVLEKAGVVLLAFQVALFGHLWMHTGLDSASKGYPTFIMATAIFVAAQRKLAAKPRNPGAVRWLAASRAAVLVMLSLGTVTVAYDRLLPGAPAAPEVLPRGLFALMWLVIALKGAAFGKLKPNRFVGLRVSWTRESRLAWDKGHRALGRILFWGGVIGLATSLVVPPFAALAMWFATVAVAIAVALLESRRTWRLDPERTSA